MTNQANKPLNDTSKQLDDETRKAIAKQLEEIDKIEIHQKKAPNTKVDLNESYDKLKFFLRLGYSFKRSCELSGENYKTLFEYYSTEGKYYNKLFQMKVVLAGSEVAIYARQNIVEAIKEQKGVDTSTDWLERKEGDEYSRIIKTQDVTERDEGVLLLREIIRDRRLYVKEKKKLKEGKKQK